MTAIGNTIHAMTSTTTRNAMAMVTPETVPNHFISRQLPKSQRTSIGLPFSQRSV
jgi:hypothetical protein